MVERKSKRSRKKRCDVVDCNKPKKRSLGIKKVKDAGLKIDPSSKRARLCKEHYKEYKKATKTKRELKRLGR